MTKSISIEFRANGEGTLTCNGFGTFACLGQPGRKYPVDLTVSPADKSPEHWSEDFQVLMKWCILIWGQKGIYIHEGADNLKENGGPSAGCIHLGPGNAKAVYDWVDERTRITIDYPWSVDQLDVALWNLHLRIDQLEGQLAHGPLPVPMKADRGTEAWSWAKTNANFGTQGCSVSGCEFSGCVGYHCCALNLSDALIRAGFTLPGATAVNYCNHARVRNADGMARICNVQNGGNPDASTWANRPPWKGIAFFEGNLGQATGHVDLWDGQQGVHKTYPSATTIWFWKLAP